LYEPTSGTSRSVKLIPYTRDLEREFAGAVHIWLADLYAHFPEISRGRHYWSISPPAAQPAPQGSETAKIGFEDDAQYLGWQGALIRSALAVPPSVRHLQSIENFKYAVSRFLLASEDLTLISVWNPTFLLILLDTMEKHAEQLIADISAGTWTFPDSSDSMVRGVNPRNMPRRARALHDAFSRFGPASPQLYSRIWPILRVLSCWTEGASADSADMLRSRFPNAALQGKGLCATEGIVSVPLVRSGGAVAAYRSHYLEFLPQNGGGTAGIDKLDIGGVYSVILTTGGGLYRYALGDIVRVSGKYGDLPVLGFLGRDHVSDMAGEKLHEQEVDRAVRTALMEAGIAAGFRMVAPERSGYQFGYVLFVQPLSGRISHSHSLASRIEKCLAANYHYHYARTLGQLLPIRVFEASGNPAQRYFDRLLGEGMKAGNIKPVTLDSRCGWASWFDGRFADSGEGRAETATRAAVTGGSAT
jgi:hypothetical protein